MEEECDEKGDGKTITTKTRGLEKSQALAMEAERTLQAMIKNRTAEQWHEAEKFERIHEKNGMVLKKKKIKLPNSSSNGSRIEMYAHWDTWFKRVVEQAGRKAATEKKRIRWNWSKKMQTKEQDG